MLHRLLQLDYCGLERTEDCRVSLELDRGVQLIISKFWIVTIAVSITHILVLEFFLAPLLGKLSYLCKCCVQNLADLVIVLLTAQVPDFTQKLQT